jgi:hypothetical protein
MESKGKSFKDSLGKNINPAEHFISQPEGPAVADPAPLPPASDLTPTGKAPAGYKLNPLYIEIKSHRLQLLIQPSLHTRIKERATKDGVSVNKLVNSFLESGLRESRGKG